MSQDMEFNALTEGLPVGHAWSGLSHHGKATCALTTMKRVLTALALERREPDEWERDHLAFALQFMEHDLFSAALNSIKLAVAPAAERKTPIPVPHANVDLSSLRGAVDRLYSRLNEPLWS